VVKKNRGVSERRSETNGLNICGETLKPSPRSLFKIIEGFLKKTDMIGGRGVLKTERLLIINCFLKRTMEKVIFDIKLVNGPGRGDCYTENYSNGAGLDSGGESFIVVNAMLLRKIATDPTSFISRKTAIGVEFFTENPFTRNYVCTGRARNKLPSLVLKKSRKLISHSSCPIGVKERGFVGFRDGRD
jgi:hypothetical protein